MIQFKKISLSKSAILLILFLTTTTTGFLRTNEDEHRIARSDGNVRETLFSMDRREENVQAQNLPIRKLDIDRQINEKDSIAERLYDRRSFRTGPIERTSQNARQSSQNSYTTRAARDIRIDERDFNNNRREIDASTLPENRRQIRENRRIAERAAISTNKHSDGERRLTDRRKSEDRVIPERRVFSNRLVSDYRREIRTNRQTRDQTRRINDLQRRSVDLTTRNIRLGERQEAISRQTENRMARDRELNQINRSAGRTTQDRRRSTELLERRNARAANVVDSQRSMERREDNLLQRIPTRITRQESERGIMESRYSTRSADRQNRETSDRRNVERKSLEDRRFTTPSTENLDRRMSLERSQSLYRQRTTERLERRNVRDSRNSFEIRASNIVDRQRRVERRETNVPHRLHTRSTQEESESRYSTRSADLQNRRSSDKRNFERKSLEDRRVARFTENQDRRLSLQRAADRILSLDKQRATERLERRNIRDSRNSFEMRASNMMDRQRSVERREDNIPQRLRSRITREESESRHATRSADVQNRRSSDRRNIEQKSVENRRFTARSTKDQDRRLTLERNGSLDRQRSTELLARARVYARNLETPALNRVDRQSRMSDRLRSMRLLERGVSKEDSTIRNVLQRQDVGQRRQRSIGDRTTRDDRVQGESRSDSTRNTRDIKQFRDITNRRDSRLSRENQRDRQGLNMSSKNEIINADRYNQLTADSRRFFEKLASQKTTRDAERVLETTRNAEGLNMKVDSNMWANTAKIVLAAFLIGQIFVNSSKQNKFRFQNIMSMATLTKQKIQ